jgi:hypothetical protein
MNRRILIFTGEFLSKADDFMARIYWAKGNLAIFGSNDIHSGAVDFDVVYGRACVLAKSAGARFRGLFALAGAMFLAAILAGGCASASVAAPPAGMDEMPPPEILYNAIVSTYRGRELPIALASERFLLVVSEYREVTPNLRKRMSSRVMRAAPGAMGLKVTAEWQRRVVIDGEPSWQAVDTPGLRKRARAAELELGRAIEQLFESWKERWQASKST